MSSIYEDATAREERRERTRGRNNFNAAKGARRERIENLVTREGESLCEIEALRRDVAAEEALRRWLRAAGWIVLFVSGAGVSVWGVVALMKFVTDGVR